MRYIAIACRDTNELLFLSRSNSIDEVMERYVESGIHRLQTTFKRCQIGTVSKKVHAEMLDKIITQLGNGNNSVMFDPPYLRIIEDADYDGVLTCERKDGPRLEGENFLITIEPTDILTQHKGIVSSLREAGFQELANRIEGFIAIGKRLSDERETLKALPDREEADRKLIKAYEEFGDVVRNTIKPLTALVHVAGAYVDIVRYAHGKN